MPLGEGHASHLPFTARGVIPDILGMEIQLDGKINFAACLYIASDAYVASAPVMHRYSAVFTSANPTISDFPDSVTVPLTRLTATLCLFAPPNSPFVPLPRFT